MSDYIYINENLRFYRVDTRNLKLERHFSPEESKRNRRALEGLKGKDKASALDISEWADAGYFSRLEHLLEKAMDLDATSASSMAEVLKNLRDIRKDIGDLLEVKNLRGRLLDMSKTAFEETE